MLISHSGHSYFSQVRIVMHIFSLRMRETAIFILPVWNLTSPSWSSIPIRYETWECRRFANIRGRYRLIMFAWILRTSWPKMWDFTGKYGKGWCNIDPWQTCSYFGAVTILVKIDQQMWWWDCAKTDRQTDTNWFYYLYHAMWYNHGADNK